MTFIDNARCGAGMALCVGTLCATTVAAQAPDTAREEASLGTISVTDEALAGGDALSAPRAGGQVASGGRLGVLGQKEAIDVPFSVVSFTDELVREQQADTVADVLLNDAAVQSTFGFGNYAELFVVRGFRLGGEDVSFGGLYGVLPRQIVNTNFVERVELFKGSNAFTNGVTPSGTGVGGAINLEPKRADDEPLTRARVGYESDSIGEYALDVGRRFGDDDQFGARVNLEYGSGDTAIDDEHRRARSASVGLDWQGDRARASLDVGYQKQAIDGGRSVVYTGAGLDTVPDAPDASTNYAPGYTFSDLETVFAMARAEYDLTNDWTVYGGVGANDTDELGEYASPTVTDTDGSATAGRLGVPFEAKAFAGQAGVRGQIDTGPVSHQINLGYSGYYRKTSTAYTFAGAQPTNIYDPADLDYPPTTFSGGDLDDPNVRSRTRADGVALSDTLGFMDDRLLVTVGARYQDIEVRNYSYAGELDRNNLPSDDKISPVYGVVYKLRNDVAVYANHIEALQPGEVAPTAAVNAGQSIGIAESKQNEVGIKYDTRRLGASLALYEIEQPNAALDNSGVFRYIGDQTNRGVEVALNGEPVDGLRLISSATLIDTKLSGTQDGANDGNDAVGVPGYRVVLGGDWDLPDTEDWTVNARAIRNGSQYVDAANDLKVDGWTRFDLGLTYRSEIADRDVTWRARVENVADENYWASAQGGYLVQGEPRTFKLSATVDF
ncbi:TonB-dependent siderophore receptor [Salinisphaera sp. T5B8]|uniref:TonB-dependent receptor n=1 Tax=Salinisphaera sp. T5B8 TaxID=1304154 RepID=UPI0033404958